MASGSQLPRPLRGIVPPIVTPLSDRDTLDAAGLERLVEHILSGGVQGLFVLGTTGEGPSLSYRLRCQMIDRVCEQVAARVPVLVGISDTSLVESVNLAEYAADAGARAVVLAPPYYYPAGQAELIGYIEQIAAELPLPVLLYNMPSHTKISFEPRTVRRLMEISNVIGLKDSSADMIYFHELRRLAEERADWSLLIGPEELLAEAVLLGAHGGVSGGANLCPRLYVDLYQAASRGDTARVAELHAKVMQIHQTIYSVAGHGAAPIAGLKCALACLGVCNDFMAEPFHRLGDDERQLIRKHLAELELPLDAPRTAGRSPTPG
jgi:4-hydroxy-tetrahydrodipicolinate synthase